MKCHRCGQSMTLFVVGDDYCQPCKRDIEAIERRAALRTVPDDAPPWFRRLRAKDMTDLRPGVA